jgi:hypothetical protein
MRNIPRTFLVGLSQWFDFQFPIPVIVRSVGSDFSYRRLKQGLGIMNNTFLDEHSDVAGSFNVFEDDRKVCSEAGMNDFVAKPIDVNEMFGKLARWLPGENR